jgi:DNA-binding winged helix-turn-helix (wHTH) protein
MDDNRDVPHGDRDAFRIGDWLVDPAGCRLTRVDALVTLEPKVMELLAFLVSREGRVVSKAEILEQVWSGRFVVESVLTRAVALLRRALGDSARDPVYIETIPRRGYRLIAPVQWLEPAQCGSEEPPPAPRTAPLWTLKSDTGTVRLRQGETIIGRGEEADVVVDSVDVSRRHARITVSGGRAVLEDLGSKNGTILNGQPISAPTPLHHLDVIVVSSVRLIVRKVSSSVETETAEP